MDHIFESAHPDRYLAASPLIDFDHAAVAETASRLDAAASPLAYLEAAFLFVRDAISHSCDLPPPARRISRTASEALLAGQGFCYVKSYLFAALLRWKGIRCGFCYQLLNSENRPTLHGLNAVCLPGETRWIRMDTRGKGLPLFSARSDALYYVPDAAKGEMDYPFVDADPDRNVVAAFQARGDFESLRRNLPDSLFGFETSPR